MLIPLRLLWNLKVKKIEKLFVGFAMCVGAITMICAIIRASSLGSFADAGQIPISWLILWGLIEGIVGKSASTSTSPHQENCSPKILYYLTDSPGLVQLYSSIVCQFMPSSCGITSALCAHAAKVALYRIRGNFRSGKEVRSEPRVCFLVT